MLYCRVLAALLFASSFAFSQSSLATYLIDTYAGSDPIRDGGQATAALLNLPADVAVGPDGSVYIADQGNRLLRRVGRDGVISSIAGDPFTAGSGDIATQRDLQPECVTVGPGGEVYFCSYRRVWKILADGRLELVAGTGGSGGGGDGGAGTEATFTVIADLAAGPDGSIYASDSARDVIRRIAPDGIIQRYAGTGAAGFSGDGGPAAGAEIDAPTELATDAAGNLYFLDSGNNRVRRVAPDGSISTVAGNGARTVSGNDGPATEAGLGFVRGLAASPDGELYLADFGNLRKVELDGTIRDVGGRASAGFVDDAPLESATFQAINGLALSPDGTIYVADQANHRVRQVDSEGFVTTLAGAGHLTGDGGPATQAQLLEPYGLVADREGNLFIADNGNGAIRRVGADGVITTIAGGNPRGSTEDGVAATEARVRGPLSLALHPNGDLYFVDTSDALVRRIDTSGLIHTVVGGNGNGSAGDGGPASEAQVRFPIHVSIDPAGNVYVTDLSSNNVRKIDAAGTISTVAGAGTFGYSGDGGPATQAEFTSPRATAVTADGEIYLAEGTRIRFIDAAGIISTLAEVPVVLSELNFTPGGSLLGVSGTNNLIYRIQSTGEFELLGDFNYGFAGDGGTADQARMYTPSSAIETADGRLFISDRENNRVRALTPIPALPEGAIRQSASFFAGTMAPSTIISVFGDHLATGTLQAQSTPLPTELGGTSATITDSAGANRPAPLFFVSRGQINLLIPDETAHGEGVLTVSVNGTEVSTPLAITGAAPGLFAANATGSGVAAAFALRVAADGTRTMEPVFQLNEANEFVPAPISLGPEGEEVYLVLYGTGIRSGGGAERTNANVAGEPLPVLFAGPAPGFVGLDQVNAGPLPRTLAGAGVVNVAVDAFSRASNNVTVEIE